MSSTIDSNASFGCFPPLLCPIRDNTFHRGHTLTRVAYGAGAQVTIAQFALRAEYERISASDGNPDLLSLSIIWRL